MLGAFPKGISVRGDVGGRSLGWPRVVIKEVLHPTVVHSDGGLTEDSDSVNSLLIK